LADIRLSVLGQQPTLWVRDIVNDFLGEVAVSWRPEVPGSEKQFIFPSFWGTLADLLITSHWKAKDRDFQEEHESFYRVVLYMKEIRDLDTISEVGIKAENEKEEKVLEQMWRDIDDYLEVRTNSTVVDLVSMKECQKYLADTMLYLDGFGSIQFAPERANYYELTQLPPCRYIGGRVGLDALDGDTIHWKSEIIHHCSGIRARLYECHSKKRSYDTCIEDCLGPQWKDGKCPFLRGPVITRNINRIDAGLWRKLRDITNRDLCRYKARLMKPIWDLVQKFVSADEALELSTIEPDREEEEDETGLPRPIEEMG